MTEKMMDTKLIEHAWILTMDEDQPIIEDGFVLIKGKRIEGLGPMATLDPAILDGVEERIDAQGMILMPGLINGHSHLFQTFLRGFADDMHLYPWLRDKVWPFAGGMAEDDFKLTGTLGCVENIKMGATTVFDQHYVHTFSSSSDAVLGAMADTGMRGVLCRTFSNYNYTPILQEKGPDIMDSLVYLTEGYHQSKGGRLEIAVGPINPWGCTVDLYQETYAYAQDQGLVYQIHTAETQDVVDKCLDMYGMRNVSFFDDMGILGPKTQLAHAIYLDEAELDLVQARGASVVHCPVANMYLADGIAPVPKMRERGIPVSLGTDGPGSNNCQDMFEVIKTASLLHKVNSLDPQILSAQEVLKMATVTAARMLGHDDLGQIKPGFLADLILVDWKKPHIAPVHDPLSAIVYSAQGSDVDTTIVDGQILMRRRKLTGVDEGALLEACQDRAQAIRKASLEN